MLLEKNDAEIMGKERDTFLELNCNLETIRLPINLIRIRCRCFYSRVRHSMLNAEIFYSLNAALFSDFH